MIVIETQCDGTEIWTYRGRRDGNAKGGNMVKRGTSVKLDGIGQQQRGWGHRVITRAVRHGKKSSQHLRFIPAFGETSGRIQRSTFQRHIDKVKYG